jgi:hypothetical protein
MKDSKHSAGVGSGCSHVEKFKADQSTGPSIGGKTQRPMPADFGGKKTGK